MIVLLDTSPKQWEAGAADDIGGGVAVGQLLTPLTRYADRGGAYAIDNGAYAGLNVNGFRSLLERQKDARERCLFVAVPDVVCSARRTLEVFSHWYPRLERWPLALVTQNGIGDLTIPWHLLSAVFIGGDDAHKDGPEADAVMRAAVAMEKHIHVGRVNGPERVRSLIDRFGDYERLSIDGSGISQFTHMRQKLGRAIRGEEEPGEKLFETDAA